MAKNKFWSFNNVLITLKAIVVSLFVGLLGFLFWIAGGFLVADGNIMVGRIIQFVWIILAFFIWGFFANKFWKWK